MLTYNPSDWEYGVQNALVQARNITEPSLVGERGIAQLIKSASYHNLYPFMGETPVMQLLKDALQTVGMSDAMYEVKNDVYSIAIEVPRTSIRDDQLGIVMERVQLLGAVALNFPNRLLSTAIEAGTTYGSYDGVAWFHDAHPIRGQQTATQDNLLAGTGVTVNALKADISSTLAAAMNWKAENGEPFAGAQRRKWKIVCPPQLTIAMLEAINSPVVPVVFGSNTAAAGVSNVGFKNAGFEIEVIPNPRLTDANDWYMFDDGPVKPMIYQEAEPVELEMLGAGSDNWVKHETAIFKARWRGGVGYNHPALAFKVVN